jgi:hypothetical protein
MCFLGLRGVSENKKIKKKRIKPIIFDIFSGFEPKLLVKIPTH